ncbi:hypothetical protein C8R47DRAFT_1068454 [Mycena vitilis]|nr:hypothetical protein C8R47DRAFT_1068454 [Mycena vitilis]
MTLPPCQLEQLDGASRHLRAYYQLILQPSIPGGYVNPQAWNAAEVNMGITAQAAPLAIPHLTAGQPLPGGGIAPPDAGNVLRQGLGTAPGAPGGGGSPHSGDSFQGNRPPGPPGIPNHPAQGPPPPPGPGFPIPPGGGGFPGGGGGGGFPGAGGGGFFPPGGGFPGAGGGGEHELPRDFIQARLLLLRALLTVPPGSAEEVREVMRTAPIVWKTMIDLDRIPDTPTLVRRVSDRDRELIVAAARSSAGDSHGVSKEYLDAQLSRAIAQMRLEQQNTGKKAWPRKEVKMGEVEDLLDLEGPAEAPEATDEQLDAEVYAAELRKQRPPPLGGYPYPRDDNNRTRLKKPPPSPCKHCGSDAHWDRECKHHVTAMNAERSWEEDYVHAYHSAVEYNSSNYVQTDKLSCAFISEVEPGEPRFVDAGASSEWDFPRIVELEERDDGPVHVLEGDVNHVIEEIGIDYDALNGHYDLVPHRTAVFVNKDTVANPKEAFNTRTFVNKARSRAGHRR